MLLQSVIACSGLAACLLLLPLASAAQPASGRVVKRTVAIDPGHGGSDTGLKGSGGTMEKAVALRLARLVENRLKDRYRVVLTRNDDYILKWPDRTGQANHARADLFVSLHTAGSYSPATRGLRVYYYAEPDVKVPEQGPDSATAAIPWRKVQTPHIPAGSILAQRVWERARFLDPAHPGSVQAAPAAVLAGAEMPAILIEAGYLTNPKQEKNLNDNKYLFKLATAISQGIDDYFNNPDKIAATDLRE